jgi:hypothetical protein
VYFSRYQTIYIYFPLSLSLPILPIYTFVFARRSHVAASDRESEELAKSEETTESPPQLLVVSAGNSFDPCPTRLSRRPSGGRCDSLGFRAATADTSVLRSRPVWRAQEFRNDECGGGIDCQQGSAARCMVATKLAATDRGPAAAGPYSAAASAKRCRPGLAGRHQTKDLLCPRDERGNAPSQGRDRRRVAAMRLQRSIAAAELSCTDGGLGTCGCERHAAQRPPPTTGSWLSTTTNS